MATHSARTAAPRGHVRLTPRARQHHRTSPIYRPHRHVLRKSVLLLVLRRLGVVDRVDRDLRQLLHPSSDSLPPKEQRRLSARLSRLIRLLRTHGIIKKVPMTHRYQLSERGCLLTAALRAKRDANLNELLRKAA